MEYLTILSDIRVVIRGFKKQDDADKAKFTLFRRDNQKKIVDSTSSKVTKASTLDPLVWTFKIDDELLKAAITKDEMSCEAYISITAGGQTWTPPANNYVIYRNKITLAAKDDEGANLAGARCVCTITPPEDYRPRSRVAATSAQNAFDEGPSGDWELEPRKVVTGDDGTVELPLAAPGELELLWDFPHYPKDFEAWLAQKGEKRETVLLLRERKARFLAPNPENGEEQEQYVNLAADSGPNAGRRLKVTVDIDRGLLGEKIYLSVELSSKDTKDLEDKDLKCDLGGDIEIGKKKTIPLTLDADGGNKSVVLDFKGWGGITAKFEVSSVEGSTDAKMSVTSWRKVKVQTYFPANGFFADDAIPDALAQKVKAAYEEVFVELEFLEPQLLTDAFAGVESKGNFEIVKISAQHAQDVDLNPGSRQGDAALVWLKMGAANYPTPANWVKNRPNASGSAAEYASVYAADPQTTLHVILGHMCYAPKAVSVNLTLTADKLVSDPQTTKTALRVKNIDARESLVLPWSSQDSSYWQVEGEETWGEVTPDFIEIDREKAKTGVYEYKVRLPDDASNDPAGLARSGKRINVYAKLRGYEYGVAGQGLYPVLYVGMSAGDEATSRGAYTLIHELAHALGFAPPPPAKSDFFYRLDGGHCAYGLKSDAESLVRDGKGTIGTTLHATITQGLPGTNIPLQLVTAGKFGKCVMFGQTHRQKTTESHFAAAIKFCATCSPLMRVTPLGGKIGGEA